MLDIDKFGVNDEEVADTSNKSQAEIDFDNQFDNEDSDVEGENSDVADGEAEDSNDSGEDMKDDSTDKRKTQTSDDNAKFAAARREAEAQAKALKQRQDNFAKNYGYNSFEEMEQAEKEQSYMRQGYDEKMAKKLVQLDTVLAETEIQKNRTRIAEEKIKLASKPFFKDLESEIDGVLQHQPNLPVELVFNVLKGERMDELMKNSKKAAAQKALNSVESKSHIRADGKGKEVDSVNVDEAEWNFYRRLNPKAKKDDYIKFLKSEKRR